MNAIARQYDKARHAVRYFLLRRLPTCKSVAPMMSESLERKLSLRERFVLKLHLGVCVWCVWYLDQLHVLRDACRERGAGPHDDTGAGQSPMPEDARDRIRRALEEQQ